MSPSPPSRSRWPWVVFLVAVPVVTTVVLVAAVFGGGPAPVNVPVSAPPGYMAVTDPYFGYAVPKGWLRDPAYSDNVGDSFYGNAAAWVAESLVVRSAAPLPGEPPPAATLAFGVPVRRPYGQSAATAVAIPGAAVGYSYQLTRPGGFSAVAIDAWLRGSGTEMWLIVHAPPGITATVLASLRGGETPPTAGRVNPPG